MALGPGHLEHLAGSDDAAAPAVPPNALDAVSPWAATLDAETGQLVLAGLLSTSTKSQPSLPAVIVDLAEPGGPGRVPFTLPSQADRGSWRCKFGGRNTCSENGYGSDENMNTRVHG